MKKLIAVSTLIAGLLIAGGCGSATTDTTGNEATQTEVSTMAPGVIFEKADATGDDNGAGSYTYPTDKVFSQQGSFDLTNFKIKDGGDTYDFIFTIGADFKNDWANAGGWDVQMFDVYLNLGTGEFKQTIAGRHVKIQEGWDKGILVGPAKASRMQKELDDKNADVADDESDFESLVDAVSLPDEIVLEGNSLTAKVAKDKIGDLSALNGVQVFITGSEGYPGKGDTYNRVVNEYAAQWRFGGGTDYDGDPNVIDMLGENSKLANYTSEEGESVYPTVNLIK